MTKLMTAIAALVLLCGYARAADGTMTPYEHIILIIAENQSYSDIIQSAHAPYLTHLAMTYGLASNFYGEVHPSEANYVAMIGGDTFGIHDDDAWYCTPTKLDRYCGSADTIVPYVDHTISQRSLVDQLRDKGLTWKGYFQSIPQAGSKVVFFPNATTPVAGQPNQLYASKHNGFINFKIVQDDPDLPRKFVGFDQLFRDLESGDVPNYAHIVPDQCNEMHGLNRQLDQNVPGYCDYNNAAGRIARGDKVINELVEKIQKSPIWSAKGNTAIVITWDEGPSSDTSGCCGSDPESAANFGGGHIPTIVITNNGPRGLKDDTPYNHYSLLRTTEEAFGIGEYLGHAKSAEPMRRLFQAQ
jgi:phospholipase C